MRANVGWRVVKTYAHPPPKTMPIFLRRPLTFAYGKASVHARNSDTFSCRFKPVPHAYAEVRLFTADGGQA